MIRKIKLDHLCLDNFPQTSSNLDLFPQTQNGFDMFPLTRTVETRGKNINLIAPTHVETVVELRGENVDSYIEVNLDTKNLNVTDLALR